MGDVASGDRQLVHHLDQIALLDLIGAADSPRLRFGGPKASRLALEDLRLAAIFRGNLAIEVRDHELILRMPKHRVDAADSPSGAARELLGDRLLEDGAPMHGFLVAEVLRLAKARLLFEELEIRLVRVQADDGSGVR